MKCALNLPDVQYPARKLYLGETQGKSRFFQCRSCRIEGLATRVKSGDAERTFDCKEAGVSPG
jgi:hypothetical protein